MVGEPERISRVSHHAPLRRMLVSTPAQRLTSGSNGAIRAVTLAKSHRAVTPCGILRWCGDAYGLGTWCRANGPEWRMKLSIRVRGAAGLRPHWSSCHPSTTTKRGGAHPF